MGKRKSWDPHGLEGWYLGPYMEHYKCHTVYVDKNRSESIADTVKPLPENKKMPVIYNQEAATNAKIYLIEAISNPSTTSPFVSIRDYKLQSIRKLADIFKQNTTPQKDPHKETVQTRVEVKHNNPLMTTAYIIVKIPGT